ncbi:MAG: ABC transporter permease [Firmicutes bacterium]|nr:ABC transporter permease [Bacillota bacterium]
MLRDVWAIIADPAFLAATLRLGTPLLLAALGGLFSEVSGVLNLGLEGSMLSGAFFGYIGALYSGSALLGLVTAALGGALTALVHAVLSIKLKTDQIVSALGVNMLALGVTSLVFHILFGQKLNQQTSPGLTELNFGVLSAMSYFGRGFFQQTGLVYFALLLIPAIHFLLYRASWGLTLRAVGEHPRAVDSVGVNVLRVRFWSVLISGLLAGLGGAAITITGINNFYDNITVGRGFVAFAAIVVGKWTPLGTGLAALLFGGGEALQLRMQAFGVRLPYQVLQMLPYALTLFVLIFFMGPSRGPSASGRPYTRNGR